MKKKFIVFLLVVLIFVMGMLVSCSNDPPQETLPTEDTKYYTVTFQLNGGMLEGQTPEGELRVKEGTVLHLSEYVPEKAGHTFAGYKSGETLYEGTAEVTVLSDLTLEAQWTERTVFCEVRLDTAGGSVAGQDLSEALRVKKGTLLSLSAYIPVKDGYIFGGWRSNQTVYSGDEQLTIDTDVTLTAQWTPIPSYTVHFEADGGTMSNSRITVREGTVLCFADDVPMKEGYDFTGWKASNGTVYSRTDSLAVTGDATFTAVWKRSVTDAAQFVFTLSEDGNSYILSGLADGFSVKDVVVPGTYNGKPVTEIGSNVFSYLDAVETVDLTNGTSLVKIGSWNFTNCKALTSVTLENCASLETVGDACFKGCTQLVTIDLKGLSSLKTIGSSCFDGYSWDGPGGLPVRALDFSDCVSLESIGQMSFWYLTEVQVLDFSQTKLTSIGRQVITHCPALEILRLPATLSGDRIGSEFIRETDNLKEISVSPLSIYLCTDQGILYDIDKTVIFKVPAAGELAEYVAPASVKTVRSQAFRNAAKLTWIDLTPCHLQEIEWNALAGCINATVKVAFNESGNNEDGTKVTLGSGWNQAVKAVEYRKVIEITVSGITDGSAVTGKTVTLQADAVYGSDICELTVWLNGAAIQKSDNGYVLPLVLGANTVEIQANHQEKTASVTLTVTRVAGNPTVTTDLTDGVISWYGSALDFTITAKDAAGDFLKSTAIEIRYDFGYGSYLQENGVTLTDNADGTIGGKVSYDFYYDSFYLEGNTRITLTVLVRDGDLTDSVQYTVDWRETSPSIWVSTDLTDGRRSDYDTPVSFSLTAKGLSGEALGASAIALQYDFGYEKQPLTEAHYTMEEQGDGTILVTVDFSRFAQMGFFDWEDRNITLILIVSDGTAEKTFLIQLLG